MAEDAAWVQAAEEEKAKGKEAADAGVWVVLRPAVPPVPVSAHSAGRQSHTSTVCRVSNANARSVDL